MNRDEYLLELRKLYDIAVEVKDTAMALKLLEKILETEK